MNLRLTCLTQPKLTVLTSIHIYEVENTTVRGIFNYCLRDSKFNQNEQFRSLFMVFIFHLSFSFVPEILYFSFLSHFNFFASLLKLFFFTKVLFFFWLCLEIYFFLHFIHFLPFLFFSLLLVLFVLKFIYFFIFVLYVLCMWQKNKTLCYAKKENHRIRIVYMVKYFWQTHTC